ncbi:MAG: hypothetical protein QM724_10125 [Flavobacteriales bacterium]
MKNVLRPLLLCCSLSPALLSAQIVLGPADMPSAGDTLRYRNGTILDFDGGDTGPGHLWDFRALAIQAEGADTAVSVGSTPLLYQLFFNNPLLYPRTRASYALRGPSFSFQSYLTVQNVYDYYKVDNTGFRNVGFGANINGLPASVQRDPVDWIHRFPLEFGNEDSSFSTYSINVPTMFTFGQQQMRRNTVDGWGTLYLPADTFEVLRVTSRLQRTDTIHVDQFGFGFTLPEPETVEYKWLAVGKGAPVLEVTTVAGLPIRTRFYYEPEDISTGMAAVAARNGPEAWPNPANEILYVADDQGRGWELIAPNGRSVRSIAPASMHSAAVDVSRLAQGVYVLRTAGATAGTRVVIAH